MIYNLNIDLGDLASWIGAIGTIAGVWYGFWAFRKQRKNEIKDRERDELEERDRAALVRRLRAAAIALHIEHSFTRLHAQLRAVRRFAENLAELSDEESILMVGREELDELFKLPALSELARLAEQVPDAFEVTDAVSVVQTIDFAVTNREEWLALARPIKGDPEGRLAYRGFVGKEIRAGIDQIEHLKSLIDIQLKAARIKGGHELSVSEMNASIERAKQAQSSAEKI